MIKYNIVVCCYDKLLVNVAAYLVPGYLCSHIYQDIIITAHYCIVLYHFNNS